MQWTMLANRACVIALALMTVAATISRANAEPTRSQAEPTRTGKERLGGKASDEQRVDNCKVPPELRGPRPRPDQCDGGAGSRARR